MAELLANDCVTRLNGAITDSDLTLTVANATGFPATGDFRIRIDNEIMTVTGVSGADFTVTRASEKVRGIQLATAHNDKSVVAHDITAGGISQFVSENGGALASVPLNNAQFKTLPTQPVQLIAAPVSGSYIHIVSVVIVSNFSVAYATNTNALDGIGITYGDSAYWGVLANTTASGNILASLLTSTVKKVTPIPTSFTVYDSTYGTDVAGGITNASNWDNKAVKIAGFTTGNANFTLGDDANTLKVNVLYRVLSL